MTLVAAPLFGFAAYTTLTLEPNSTLTIEGTSTVKGFKCSAKKLDAAINAEPGSPLAELVKGGTVVIPVEQIDCGNGTMNEHMRKALKLKENPEIVFTLASYTLTGNTAALKGTLKIAGVTKPIEIPATVIDENNGVVRVKATKPLNMTEWSVKPPSLMLGTMKVRENVTVSFDVAVKR
jgi:polyisoprenoid-binding protein YceI